MPQDADKALRLLEEAIRLEPHMLWFMASWPGAMSSATCVEGCTLKRGGCPPTRLCGDRSGHRRRHGARDGRLCRRSSSIRQSARSGDFDRSIAAKSLLCACVWLSSIIRAWMGDCEIAIEHSKMGIRLSPYDPLIDAAPRWPCRCPLLRGKFRRSRTRSEPGVCGESSLQCALLLAHGSPGPTRPEGGGSVDGQGLT